MHKVKKSGEKEDGTVTIRDRDTMIQERILAEKALEIVQDRLKKS